MLADTHLHGVVLKPHHHLLGLQVELHGEQAALRALRLLGAHAALRLLGAAWPAQPLQLLLQCLQAGSSRAENNQVEAGILVDATSNACRKLTGRLVGSGS